MEKALIVTVGFESGFNKTVCEDDMIELRQLVLSTGAVVCGEVFCKCRHPQANLLIGRGKTETIAEEARRLRAQCVVFDVDLSSTQQRNLEEIIQLKTIDRTQLILDIFSRRARSLEGKVQVELAQLTYLLPRLTGKGIVLSRLGGGIGTRGPGEQKLEADRRRIRRRISHLKDELKKLKERRGRLREKRQAMELPTIALIGYTNAGKSTLLNRLTGAQAFVADSLFSTLDPLARRLVLPTSQVVLFLDTVGFLNNLPHHLIEAFHATLEEAAEADLLLHVIDMNDNRMMTHIAAVYRVLEELCAMDRKILTVLNKKDLVEDSDQRSRIEKETQPDVVISATRGDGLEKLISVIADSLKGLLCRLTACVPATRQDIVHKLYNWGKVIQREDRDGAVILTAVMRKHLAQQIVSYYKEDADISLKNP
ncbi:MAG: GTPase HflX [Candidatus Omnitrophica bacterium]|nr:GTPase HflX [Candidatus Omnitrophota bacterium]